MANNSISEKTYFNNIPCYISFPKLVDGTVSKYKDGTAVTTFEVTQVIDPTTDAWQKQEADVYGLARRVLRAKFGEGKDVELTGGKSGKTEYGSPFRYDSDFVLEKYPQYKGMVIIPTRSKGDPVDLIDVQGKPLANPKKELYPGAICLVSFGFYAWDFLDPDTKMRKKGVTAALRCVMKLKDSEPWVMRASAEKDFADFDPSQYGVDNAELLNQAAAMGASRMRDL